MKLKLRFFQFHYGICFFFSTLYHLLPPDTRVLPGERIIKSEIFHTASPDTVTDMDGF